MIYVMSDVHGEGRLFFQMLEVIGLRNEDRLYILGDLVAKGPDSLDLVRYVMEQRNIVLLRGNHEQRLLQYEARDMRANVPADIMVPWAGKDGRDMIGQLAEMNSSERDRILDFLGNTPLNMEIRAAGRSFLMVHGAPDREMGFRILENRYENPEAGNRRRGDETVIVGHTPTFKYGKSYSGYMIIKPDKIFLDCGAAYGLGLGCLELETGREFYVRR